MSRRFLYLAALALLLAAPAGAGAAGGAPAKLKSVKLHIFNRVFPNFHDQVVATPNKEFRVGDTEFTARIIRFEPDFSLDVKTHKVFSRTTEPRNPAFQVVVSRRGAPHDTSWAFFNMPPHFGIKEELAFVATRIDFLNRPPLVSSDSIALRIEPRRGAAH